MIAPLLLAAVLASPSPAAIEPTSVRLYAASTDPNASAVQRDRRLYVQYDAAAELVSIHFVVGAGTTREATSQSGLAALSAEVILHTKVDGVTLLNRVAAAGGSIDFVVDPDVIRFSIEALPDALPAIALDIATAIAAPDTSDETIAVARASLDKRIGNEQQSPILVGLEMLRGSYYAGGAGLPVFGTTASVAGLRGADVASYIAAHYVRSSAYAIAAGRVDDSVVAAVQTAFEGFPTGTQPASPIVVKPPPAAGKEIVTSRSIVVPLVVIGFPAPALGDPDFAPMLVLGAILENLVPHNAAAALTDLGSPVATIYEYDVKPATFAVAINGGSIDPTQGVHAVSELLRHASEQPLETADLVRLQAQARGQWLLQDDSLSDRAWQIGAAIGNGADPNAAAVVAEAIDHVTVDDVMRVARMYLQHSTVAVVYPRRAGNDS